MPSMKELVAVAKGTEKTASDMYLVNCGGETLRAMKKYKEIMKKQQERLEWLM